MNNCTYNLRQANPYYQSVVNSITSKLNMNPIQVYAADTANACATLFKNGEPIITYNPQFIMDVQNHSLWAMYFVFAHEVAHHYNEDLYGHFLNRLNGINPQSHRKELNADYFAGWVLRCEGASLYDARSLYEAMDMQESYTHPGAYQRKVAMENGWREANCQISPPKKVVSQPQTQSPDLADVFLGIGILALLGIGVAALGGRKG